MRVQFSMDMTGDLLLRASLLRDQDTTQGDQARSMIPLSASTGRSAPLNSRAIQWLMRCARTSATLKPYPAYITVP
jgi:hypothetical protein